MNKVQYVKWLYGQIHDMEVQGQERLFRTGYIAGAKEAYLTAIDKAKGLQMTTQPDQRIIQEAVDLVMKQTIGILTDAVDEVLEDIGVDVKEKTIFNIRLLEKIEEQVAEVMGDD